MGDLWGSLSRRLWREDFWLPEGLSWEDLHSNTAIRYPDPLDIWIYPILLSFVYIFLCVYVVEPFVMTPLAAVLGVSNKRTPAPPPNAILERIYKRYHTKVPVKEMAKSCEVTGLTDRQIERWLRRRYKSQRFNPHDLFLDGGTKFLTHGGVAVYGYYIMLSKPWVWDIILCWEEYPHHTLHDDVWWYYVIVLAVYWKHALFVCIRPGKKLDDQLAMLLHHVLTILLMTFSWTCNFIRIGSLVLMVHEIADVPLIAAKMCRYAGRETGANILFPIFYVMWVVTRCGFYPFWVMRSVFFDATRYMFMPSAYVFIGLLTGLLLLNLMWTWLITGIIVKKFSKGGKLQDFRSSSSDNDGEEDLQSAKKLN